MSGPSKRKTKRKALWKTGARRPRRSRWKDILGVKQGKPSRHRPIDHDIRILTRLGRWHRRKVAQLVNDFVLEEFAGLIARGADACRQIRAPSRPLFVPMLRPTERHEIEA